MQSVFPLSCSSNWNGDANIVISTVLVRIDYQWIRSALKKPETLSICMENPLIAGIIQLERFIPVDIFHKKVIPFEVLPFSRFYREDGNSLYLLFD